MKWTSLLTLAAVAIWIGVDIGFDRDWLLASVFALLVPAILVGGGVWCDLRQQGRGPKK
jgi:high-affinity Fe2+/Pb2+ permease